MMMATGFAANGAASGEDPGQASGDDIGGELVFNEGNPVAQPQLALFQALHLNDIAAGGRLKRLDGGVEIAMLLPQPLQLPPEFGFLILRHEPAPFPRSAGLGRVIRPKGPDR